MTIETLQSIIFVLVFLVLLTAGYAGITGAPWVPTKKGERESLTNWLKLKPNQRVYDLGAGDGSLLFTLIKRFPNVHLIGIEISILPYLISLIRKLIGGSRYQKIELRYQNLYRTNLSDADLIFVYLMAKRYERLKRKLTNEVKDDCLIVIEAWPIPNMEPFKKITGNRQLPLFVYQGKQFRVPKLNNV